MISPDENINDQYLQYQGFTEGAETAEIELYNVYKPQVVHHHINQIVIGFLWVIIAL